MLIERAPFVRPEKDVHPVNIPEQRKGCRLSSTFLASTDSLIIIQLARHQKSPAKPGFQFLLPLLLLGKTLAAGQAAGSMMVGFALFTVAVTRTADVFTRAVRVDIGHSSYLL